MHIRRRGRNLGVGLLLGALIAIIFGLTYVKITSQGFQAPSNVAGAE
nr:cytochrome C oxidase assembly protein [Phaeobacter sp. J2-8]